MVSILLPLRRRLRRLAMEVSGARSKREENSLNSRWIETRVDVKGTSGIEVRVENWFNPAWSVVRAGYLAAMWQISCQSRRVSSRASSVTPLKAPSDSWSFSSSWTFWKRFPL